MPRALFLPALFLSACLEYRFGSGPDDPPVADTGPQRATPPPVGVPPEPLDGPDSDPIDTGTPADCEVDSVPPHDVPQDPACAPTAWTPAADPWDIVVEWHWSHPSGSTEDWHAWNLPLVGQFQDGDGDGDIDASDPSAVVVEVTGESYPLLTMLDGRTGTDLAQLGVSDAVSGNVLADLDGDGRTDVLDVENSGWISLLDESLWLRWIDVTGSRCPGWGATVADLDGDGSPEAIHGTRVYDGATGALELTLSAAPDCDIVFSTTGDLDLDGRQEIVYGPGVYDSATGAQRWAAPLTDVAYLHAALADVDGDPEGEVIFITPGLMSVFEHDGTPIGETAVGAGEPGPPCIADFDGDGVSEIAWSTGAEFALRELDGAPIWSAPVEDTSGLAGCSGFDFDGDGAYEVLYADEVAMMILDGATGATIFRYDEHSSDTIFEYPVVADVDADGSAEIVLASSSLFHVGDQPGVTVLGHAGGGWAPVGANWPSHDFDGVRVDPDGGVPTLQPPGWQIHNQLRARTPVPDPPPDLAAALVDLCVADCDRGPIRATLEVWNEGSGEAPARVPWALYRLEGGVPTLLRSGQLAGIPSGRSLGSFELELLPGELGPEGLRFTVDDRGDGHDLLYECDETDNQVEFGAGICG